METKQRIVAHRVGESTLADYRAAAAVDQRRPDPNVSRWIRDVLARAAAQRLRQRGDR